MAQISRDEKVRLRRERDLEKRSISWIGKVCPDGFRNEELSDGFQALKQDRDSESWKLECRACEDFAVFTENAFTETGNDQPGFEQAKNLARRAARRDETRNDDIRIEDDLQRRRLARTSRITALISRRVIPFGNLLAESR